MIESLEGLKGSPDRGIPAYIQEAAGRSADVKPTEGKSGKLGKSRYGCLHVPTWKATTTSARGLGGNGTIGVQAVSR